MTPLPKNLERQYGHVINPRRGSQQDDLLSKLKDYPRDPLSQILDSLRYNRKQGPDERSEQNDEKGGNSKSNSIDRTCFIAVFSRCIHGMCVG
jgi:hypothetical protein